MNARYGDNNMIKEYQNGSDFILENSSFLDQNKYMSVFFYLDAKVLNKISSTNYAIKVENAKNKLLAIKVEPYNLLIYGDKECLGELLKYLKDHGYECSGIMCDTSIGDKLIKELGYVQSIGMDFMETRKYTTPSSKEVIKATIDDVDEIFACYQCFLKDCGLKDKANRDNIIKKIDNFRIVKVNNMIASMAAYTKATDDSCRITHVYTRPEYRCKGFARKVVNCVKNEILDMGLIATLNVDQNNPISNHLYSSLGFKKVFSQGIYYLNDGR